MSNATKNLEVTLFSPPVANSYAPAAKAFALQMSGVVPSLVQIADLGPPRTAGFSVRWLRHGTPALHLKKVC